MNLGDLIDCRIMREGTPADEEAVALRIIAASASESRFFEFVTVMGVLVCLWIGSLRAMKRDPDESSFLDPFNVAPHWRFFVKAGAALMAIGLVGLMVVAVMP